MRMIEGCWLGLGGVQGGTGCWGVGRAVPYGQGS